MHIEQLATDSLTHYARNSRTHSEQQINQIAASLQEFGFCNPVLIDASGEIIAGHGRVMAAKQIGLEQIPCIRLGHLTPDQKRAYVIADNKLAENAGWDVDALHSEIAALSAAEFDTLLLGFEAEEIKGLLDYIEPTIGQTDPDDIPPEPEQTITQPGDIWQLGNHRIICGDSTDAATVTALLKDESPHLMVTDPPYGVEYDATWRNEAICANRGKIGARAIGAVLNDNRADWREAWALFPGDVAYVWHAPGPLQFEVFDSLYGAGFVIRNQIIWAKSHLVIGRGHYHSQHEACWYAAKKGKTSHWSGDRKQTTLWNIPKPTKSETGHSTQKPVECMLRPIRNNSKPGDAVYEPFSGSGTTIIAAEMSGRRCFAVELHPAYVDIAVTRWENFTGQKAVKC